MTTMWDKQTARNVEVHQFFDDNTALVYDPYMASQQNGNGWQRRKLARLIPYPDADIFKLGIQSKTEYNKAKSKLKLLDAEWQTEDGLVFDHAHINDAVEHQLALMQENKEDE